MKLKNTKEGRELPFEVHGVNAWDNVVMRLLL